jgi:hypothetical protein
MEALVAVVAVLEVQVLLEGQQLLVKAILGEAIFNKRGSVLLAVAVVQVLLDQTALVTWLAMAALD